MAYNYHTGQRSHRPHGQQPQNGPLVSDLHTRSGDTHPSDRHREFTADGPWENKDLVQGKAEVRKKRKEQRRELERYRTDDEEKAKPGPEFHPLPRGSHSMTPINGALPLAYPRTRDLSVFYHHHPPPPRKSHPAGHPEGFGHVRPSPWSMPYMPRYAMGPPVYLQSLRDAERRDGRGENGREGEERSSARRRREVD